MSYYHNESKAISLKTLFKKTSLENPIVFTPFHIFYTFLYTCKQINSVNRLFLIKVYDLVKQISMTIAQQRINLQAIQLVRWKDSAGGIYSI